MAHKAGGGLRSNKVTRQGVRTGARATKINERGVAQIGTAGLLRGDIEPVRVGRKPAGTPGTVPLGNEVAGNVGSGGPGKGRVLYGQSGSQGVHGPVNPGNPPAAGELFPGWPAKGR